MNAAGVLALLFFAPLAVIYGRSVARALRREAARRARPPAALFLPKLVLPLLVGAAFAYRLADPDGSAGDGLSSAVLRNAASILHGIGSLAVILFFLAVPFVLGRLFAGLALAFGLFPGEDASLPDEAGEPKKGASSLPRDPAMTRRLTIAIDGPAAAGKGTLASRLAEHYALPYLDTGLLYRAVGRLAQQRGLDLDDPAAMGALAQELQPSALDDGTLRGREAGELASRVAVHPPVREALGDFQRRFASRPEGAVLDGRDIGTVIAPDAEVKIFVTASAEVRARRRTEELAAKGRSVDYERILAEVKERDARDAGRSVAPLKPAPDAHLLDTSEMDIETAFRAACEPIDRFLSQAEGASGRS